MSLITIVFFKRIVYNINVVRNRPRTVSEILKKGEEYELQKPCSNRCGSGTGSFTFRLCKRRKFGRAIGQWRKRIDIIADNTLDNHF